MRFAMDNPMPGRSESMGRSRRSAEDTENLKTSDLPFFLRKSKYASTLFTVEPLENLEFQFFSSAEDWMWIHNIRGRTESLLVHCNLIS